MDSLSRRAFMKLSALAAVVLANRETFVAGVEPSECQGGSMSNALRELITV